MAPTVSPDAADTVQEVFIVWGGSRGKEQDSIPGAFHPEEYYTNNNWVRNFANTAAGFVHTMPVTNMFFLGDAAMFGKDNALNYSYVHWMALMEPFLITRIPLYVAAADRDMMHSEGTAYNDTQDEFRNVLFYNVPVNGPTPWVDPHRETWNYDKLTYWMYSQTSNTLILNMDTYYVTGRLIDPMDNGEVDDHQLEWLQNSIANNDYFKSAKNRILITHSPAFDPEDNFNQPNKPNRSALWKTLAENKFDAYLCGHDRLYSARQFTKDPFKDGQTYSRPMWQVISGAGGAETDKVDKINVNLHDWNIQTMETFLLVKFYAHGIKIIVYGTDIDYSVPPRPMDGTNEYPNLTLWIPKP
jgi:hypothetical protein